MKFSTLAFAVALLAWASVGNASIVDVTAWDDGDGVIDCSAQWYPSEGELAVNGAHMLFEAGHLLANITTNTAEDPSLTLISSMDNETGSSRAGYHVNVSMPVPFVISDASVTTPGDWSSVITSMPVLVGTEYVGQIDYTAGTIVKSSPPELVPDTLEFRYKITFAGLTKYRVCQEMIPIAVPEPSVLVLLVGGLFGVLALRRK